MGIVGAQPFGRFGYVSEWSIPGLRLDAEGFAVDYAASDKFYFMRPLKGWKPVATADTSQTVGVQPYVQCPTKLRQDLTSPGFLAFFDHGFRFRLGSLSSPVLSWGEGSIDAGADVPTPPVRWAVLSFRDNQPPMLFAFPWKSCALKLTGKTGQWFLSSEGSFSGWIRMASPLGIVPFRTNSVSEMGKLVSDIKAQQAFWTQPPPVLLKTDVTADETSVTAAWTFDRANAVVPPPVFLGNLGGYGIQVLTKTTRLEAPTLEGPLSLVDGTTLKVRFPIRRMPMGRAVLLGKPPVPIATASHLDVRGVYELGVANLFASTPKPVRDQAGETYRQYVEASNYQVEPFTGQRLPYGADGTGIDVLAAQALLMQTTLTTDINSGGQNSLFSSLMVRRDWLSWRIWGKDRAVSRRASAITAIAAAIAPEPERRLDAAMLQAGLVAERGLAVWLKRNKLGEGKPLLETAEHVRADFFMPADYRRPNSIGAALFSGIRAFGDAAITLDGSAMTVAPFSPGIETVTLNTAFPITLTAADPATTIVEQLLNLTVIRLPASNGGSTARSLTCALPNFAKLPAMPADYRFVETTR